MPSWIISPPDTNKRLDVFLTEQTGLTRSQIQKAIKNGEVAVNGKSASVHRFLKKGDEIVYRQSSIVNRRISNEERSMVNDPRPTIVSETPDWLVINKPAGLLVHPDAKTKHGTLVDWLIEHDPKIGRVGGHPERPGIVHRLDREVRGLMLVAKTHAAYEALQKQFAERRVEKIYLALVFGALPKDEGDIKFRIARSKSKARMAARPSHEEAGRAAWTHYRVLGRFTGATLLELHILSGRTHQIRAHLYALGHPVIGDALYASRRVPRNLQPPRLMLQSVGLAFDDPASGERQSFHLDPDPAFATLINHLSSSGLTRGSKLDSRLRGNDN